MRKPARRRSTASPGSSGSGGPQRFHLELESTVEEAPSIGPKTAARLATIGIHTVSDLLAADPIETARRLDARHIKSDRVREWQRQARLVYQIPRLRGHDAQILVALDLVHPDDIARLDPRQLWGRVETFCNTREGERIVRGGRKPDFNEVSDWIAWSGNRRALELDAA